MRKGATPMSINRVNVPTASLVCRVENTRCPVRDACIAIWAVSRSRISPTMMTSGLPQKGAQGRGKSEADRGVHRHLHDALDLVFHGILCRQELQLRGVDRTQSL